MVQHGLIKKVGKTIMIYSQTAHKDFLACFMTIMKEDANLNKIEAIKTLAVLQSCYPNQYKNLDDAVLSMTAQTWASAFADIPFEVVFNAVQQHILKSQFIPTVAEIRLRCVEMTNPNKPKTAFEAWEDVILGIKRFGYYQQDKAFETFDERTKRAVRVIGWQNICQSENIGIERANFIKFYDSYNMETQDNYLFPKALTDKVQQIMAEQKLKALEDKNG